MTTSFALQLRECGISVPAFAARAGCSRSSVYKVANGKRRLTGRFLEVLAQMRKEPTLEQKIVMKIDLGIERNMPVLLSPRELRWIRNKSFLITPMERQR